MDGVQLTNRIPPPPTVDIRIDQVMIIVAISIHNEITTPKAFLAVATPTVSIPVFVIGDLLQIAIYVNTLIFPLSQYFWLGIST